MWEEAFVFVHCEEVLLKYDKHPYINCEHDPIFCGFVFYGTWNREQSMMKSGEHNHGKLFHIFTRQLE